MNERTLIERLNIPWPEHETEEVTLPAWVLELCAEAATTLVEKNAELAAVKAYSIEMLHRKDEQFERAERAEARVAELEKALDEIEAQARLVPVHSSPVTSGQILSSKMSMIRDIAFRAARRVREGGCK